MNDKPSSFNLARQPAETATKYTPAPPTVQAKTEVMKQGKKDIGNFLEKHKGAIAKALPKHLTVDRILRIALTEIRRNTKLLQCKEISLISAIVQSAQLGLTPDSLTGQAYLIPYKNKGVYECQFQIGYKGMMRLVYNTGQVQSITAHAVYNNDIFDFEYGLKPKLRHIPSHNGSHKESELKWVYAVAYLKNGGTPFIVITKEDVDNHRKYSQSSSSSYSPWNTAYVEMAKKTSIRMLCKYLPQSTEDNNLQKAVAIDEASDRGEQNNDEIFEGEIFEAEQQEEQNYADNVAEMMTGEEVANG